MSYLYKNTYVRVCMHDCPSAPICVYFSVCVCVELDLDRPDICGNYPVFKVRIVRIA